MFILLAITSTFTFAQSENDAKLLLDQVAEKVANYDNVVIEFNHILNNTEADVHQETLGKVILKGDLYHLNYMGTEQLFDGKKTYLLIHEDEEVIIQNNQETDGETLTPSKMFSFYKNGYTYQLDTLKNNKGLKIQYVKLIPIDSHSEIAHILIGIDIKTKHIYNIIETGNNNTTTTLQIKAFKTNQTLSKKQFTFDIVKYRDQKQYTISEPK